MEKETFSQPEVAALVNQEFVPVLLDADKNQALMKHLKITGIPALLVVSPEMVILNRMTGFQTKEQLFPKLQGDLSKFASSRQPAPVATASIPNTVQPQPGQPVARDAGSTPDPFGTVSMTQAASPQLPLEQQQQRSPVVHELPAFEGFCLPSVQESRSLVSGTPQFKLKYHGKTLYFQNAAQAEKFKANPELYFPMNDGTCTVTLVETGKAVEGKLEYAAMFRGRLWFASTQENMQKFVGSPAAYANALEAR